jgi:thiol-disulfide isomerase/thioredoxin
VIGGQLDVPAIVELGAAYTFGGGHEHHHHHGDDDDEHEHAPHAPVDTTGADVADVGKDGERVALAPVPGKVTIFDFWAEWCEPCKNLEPVLVELARAHPDRVALRRVEVIDWDSPVAAQHLIPGGFGLPHVKVFDAHGTLVLEQSSAPGKLEALIAGVRALVEPPGAQAAQPPPLPPGDALVIEIAATDRGFEPAAITVPSHRAVVLRFTRTSDKTCATDVVIDHDGQHVIKDLPLNQPASIPLVFDQPGTITYGCGMNMFHGTITVQ